MALAALEMSVRSKLRSGVAITSLAQCVIELVDNSIDAGGSCVAVRVDLSKFKLQVTDNGRGITESELSLVGERYVTSKCHTLHDLDHNLQHLGYRGEALASIVEVSQCVEISSRHHLSQNTFDKVFLNGQLVGVKPAITHRQGIGTTVTLLDLFYNMPVRRKAMVDVFELEQVKKAVECIAMVNPSISFTVHNDLTGALVLQTHKTNSLLSNFGLLFARSRVGGMKEVYTSQSKHSVSGYISLETHHNSTLQFIYVNRRIVRRTPLHACINSQLNNSLLTKKQAKKWQTTRSSSPPRGLERHPVYVLLIVCPRSEYDICLEPAKTLVEFKDWNKLINMLTSLTNKFLHQHYLYTGLGHSDRAEHSDICSSSQSRTQHSTSDYTKDLVQPLVQSKVVKRKPIHETSIPLVKRDIECSTLETSPLSSITPTTQTEHFSTPAQSITPTLFSLTTYQSQFIPPPSKATPNQPRPSFMAPYTSPTHSESSVSSRVQERALSAQPSLLRPTLYSPLCSSVVSVKLANLVKDKLLTDCSQTSLSHDLVGQPVHHSTPNVEDTTAHHLSMATIDPLIETGTFLNLKSGEQTSITVTDDDGLEWLSGSNKSSTYGPVWKEQLDPETGRKTYVHSLTGNCSYESPNTLMLSATSHSGCTSLDGTSSNTMFGVKPLRPAPQLSHDCISLMPPSKTKRLLNTSCVMSTTSNLIENSPNVKWRDQSEMQCGSEKTMFETLIRDWKNPTFQPGHEDVLNIGRSGGSRQQIRVHNLINKFTFTKDMFKDLVVLNQVDNKFIACLLSKERNGARRRLLVMVDQHAAHERVRLEALLSELYEDSTELPVRVKSSPIHPPLVMTLSSSELSLARHFRKHLDQIGLNTGVNARGQLLVHSLPTLFVEEGSRGQPSVTHDSLQEMLIEHLELLQSTGGESPATPAVIIHRLNSQACHSAIKFGDPLTVKECHELIHSLSKCKLPFQCAHGRPSIVPLLDLDSLHKHYPPQQRTTLPSHSLTQFLERLSKLAA